MAKRCAVLFVNPGPPSHYLRHLREMGFALRETAQWPADDHDLRDFHVLIIRVAAIGQAPMLAARLRARPHCHHRLLIALVAPDAPQADRRSALAGGFDDVVADGCDVRELVSRILRGLRTRPELRCTLPPLPRKAVA